MSIHARFSISCTRCNRREHNAGCEYATDALLAAHADGWRFALVMNGSIWHYCPECWNRGGNHTIREVSAIEAVAYDGRIEKVDSGRDSGEKPLLEKSAQPVVGVAHPLGVEPKTF